MGRVTLAYAPQDDGGLVAVRIYALWEMVALCCECAINL